MGDSYQIIVDLQATEDEAQRLGAEVRQWLIEQRIIAAEPGDCVLGDEHGYPPGEGFAQALEDPAWAHQVQGHSINGVELLVGRHVFYSMGLELRCRHCG